MSILYGLYQADEGEIYIDGQKITIPNPSQAINFKIGMVHQHFMLVPSLTIVENIIIGMEPKQYCIFVDLKKLLLDQKIWESQETSWNTELKILWKW
jgi:ABC-type uncharacterized transport system ATPase subunit